MGYKYFDTIDEEYIQFFSQKFPSSLEDLERIKNAKIEKYKDIDLGSLYKISLCGICYAALFYY